MTLDLTERFQKLQDMIEKRDVTWFIGCTVLVALVSLCGV